MPHCQESTEFQAALVQILPYLREAVHAQHYVEHKCELCAVPVVTLDAKYGLTCALCNHREGGWGGVHLDLGSSGTCLRPKVRPHVDCGETAKRPPGLGALQHRAPAHSQKHDF